MKYFGTCTDNQDLVPKSYIDDLFFSHDQFTVNVAYRVAQDSLKWDWDNEYSENESNVSIFIDTSYRYTSIDFVYNAAARFFHPDSVPTSFPQNISDVGGNSEKPTLQDNTIYYVLELNDQIKVGRDIYVSLRPALQGGDVFEINTYKIRVLIPENFIINEDPFPVFYNGKWVTTLEDYSTRNGYVDLGYYNNRGGSFGDFFSATLHIYTDGEVYYINSCPFRGVVT